MNPLWQARQELFTSRAGGRDPHGLMEAVLARRPSPGKMRPFMALTLHDTLTRQSRSIQPLDGKTLRFYCCGPTVYGPAHIGNFRTFVAQDVFRRVVEMGGLPTLHVRNLTDVDDKTIRDSQKAVNDVIRELASSNDHVSVLDWGTASAQPGSSPTNALPTVFASPISASAPMK